MPAYLPASDLSAVSVSNTPNLKTIASAHVPTHKAHQASTSSLRSSLEFVPYRPLSGSQIDNLLRDTAHPYSETLMDGRARNANTIKADGVNFQPCSGVQTQDRYVVEQFAIQGREADGLWTLTGVFDGHLGTATVEHTAHHLPVIIQQFLASTQSSHPSLLHPSSACYAETVSEILQRAISSFDDDIVRDVLDLFPTGAKYTSSFAYTHDATVTDLDDLTQRLDELDDEEVRRVINDYDGSGENYRKVQLCMYGCTALVCLVDPARENIWIANCGDCRAGV